MVQIVQKQDQRTGNLTEGIVTRILTSSNFHPRGIKVELDNGKIGRVQNIIWWHNAQMKMDNQLQSVGFFKNVFWGSN